MDKSIHGKTVLVTGASGGIGSAIATLFASNGAMVGIHYNTNKHDAEKVAETIRQQGGTVSLFEGDLLDQNTRDTLIDRFVSVFGRIDILINNAGAAFDYVHFSKLDSVSWDKTFDLNTKAPFYLIGRAFEQMKRTGVGGKIINVSSVSVKYGGSANSLHYSASKAALESLTVGFAREGAAHNILVNCIRCGVIDTPMRTKIAGYNEDRFRERVAMIPLKKVGRPIDIASMALFLASESGNFITGEIFNVTGGD